MMNKLMNLRNNKRGFTLVEIIVVLVIIAILAAIAIPTMMGFVRDAQDQALIAEARTAYYAAQSIATETAGTALVSGVGDVDYPNSNAAWTAAINAYLDSPANNVIVVLATGNVRPGTVSEIYYEKENGGRTVRIALDLQDLGGNDIGHGTGVTPGTEVFATLTAAGGSGTSTIKQTVAADGTVS